MRLRRDGAEAHGPGAEPLDDLAGGLHLIDWNGTGARLWLELQEAAKSAAVPVTFVDEL